MGKTKAATERLATPSVQKAWQTQMPTPHTRVKDEEASRHVASKTAIAGIKHSQQEICMEIGEPVGKKIHTAPASQDHEETAKKRCLRHQSPKPLQASGQL